MNVKDLGHWTDKRKEDEDLDAPISGRKNASNFGLEIMPAISGRKICRQFRVGNYAGDFGPEDMQAISSEDMPTISGRKKCRQCRIGTKCRQIRTEKKMPVFSGGDKIAGELTGLNKLKGP